MIIADHRNLSEIKKEFQEKFPYLRLEFFRVPHEEGAASPKKEILADQLLIGDARTVHTEGDLSIHGNLKIGSLEQALEERYGLHAQVLYRSTNNVWLQTTSTDHWTLADKNQQAAERLQQIQ